jgi:hypothetical protein
MTEETKDKLNSIRENSIKITEQIEILQFEYSKIQAEAIKEIVTSWIEDKDLKDYCLTFPCERFDEDYSKPVFMELECFVSKTQDLVREKREELVDLIDDYSPTTGYHFGILINEFVTFWASDYDFGFKFAYFDADKIKEFAKEYGLIIKCSTCNSIESYDIRIQELTEEKERLSKYQKIFE